MHALSALFLDTYRQLNSQKLFWLTLVLSLVVVAACACVGINKEGITFLWFEIGNFDGWMTSDRMSPAQFYKQIFVTLGIGFWLSWLATILALISTAGMIPTFIASGAIELTLSKPVNRVTLFLLKFAMGLLFTALQVSVFALACFLLIGIRGGEWQPKVFLAIPLVVLFYSYLFSICALIGLLTRSTIAALLLTLLAWFGLFAINAADQTIMQFKVMNQMQVERTPKRIESAEKDARRAYEVLWLQEQGHTREEAQEKGIVAPEPTREKLREVNKRLVDLEKDLADQQKGQKRWKFWNNVAFATKTALPKTSETTQLLERTLMKDFDPFRGPDDEEEQVQADAPISMGGMSDRDRRDMQRRLVDELTSRSPAWIIGTSLLFEAVLLGIACWIFARRDF
jgi:ABC-type transport system involved in multi-copper enzyme maturation permease subunit